MNELKILLAEDHDLLREALTRELWMYGCKVTAVADGYTALAKAVEDRPHVMVLDLNLPAGDGFSVHERMKRIPELRDVPVIYTTGDSSPRLDAMAKKLGAVAMLHKPFELHELVRLMENVTTKRAA